MTLDVQFTAPRTDLIFQENPICRLVLTNNGPSPVEVLHPMFNPHMPVMRVMNTHTGVEVLQQGQAPMTGSRYQPLPPGQKLEYAFPLLSKVTLPLPGEYEVSAVFPPGPGKRGVESNTVRFQVQPVTPKNLSLVSVAGGWSGVQYGVCINVTSDPPEILRYAFSLGTEDGVDDVQRVVGSTLRTMPVASVPTNQTVSHSHWIAWKDKEEIFFTHTDAAQGPLPSQKVKVPAGLEAEIVAPIHIDSLSSGQLRPTGAMLLWMSDPGGSQTSRFQVVVISPVEKATPGAYSIVPESRPLWMTSHVQSGGLRFVTYVGSTATGISLNAILWPEPSAGDDTAQKLIEWENVHFLAAGAVMNREDAVHGAILVLPTEVGNPKLEILSWALDKERHFTEQARHEVPWKDGVPVTEALVRVSPDGTPAALVRDDENRWFVYWQGNVFPAPGLLGTTRLPLDLAFLNQSEPVFIAASAQGGFQVLELSGQPLRKRSG